jgi:hypothetical protein
MSVILMLSSCYLVYKVFDDNQDTPFVHNIIRKAYKYSGIDPESFNLFVKNINLSLSTIEEPRVSSDYLYKALDNLEDVALYNDYDVHEEIREIIIELAYEVERLILERSIKLKKPFRTRYLNDRVY